MRRGLTVCTALALTGLLLSACRTHLTPQGGASPTTFGSGSDDLGAPPAGAPTPDPEPATGPPEDLPTARFEEPTPPPVAARPPSYPLPCEAPTGPPGHSEPPLLQERDVPCYPRRSLNTDPLAVPDPARPWRNAYWGTSLSLFPNVGLAFEVGGVFQRNDSLVWSWEAEVTWQFLDDELFADDGNPAAGDWWQLQLGVKAATAPLARRHWTGRTGLVWFHAGENPNVVEEKGNYFGVYAGIGFETDINASLTTGPELSAMLVMHEGGRVEVVPQLNWHFIWNF